MWTRPGTARALPSRVSGRPRSRPAQIRDAEQAQGARGLLEGEMILGNDPGSTSTCYESNVQTCTLRPDPSTDESRAWTWAAAGGHGRLQAPHPHASRSPRSCAPRFKATRCSRARAGEEILPEEVRSDNILRDTDQGHVDISSCGYTGKICQAGAFRSIQQPGREIHVQHAHLLLRWKHGSKGFEPVRKR